jgi:hypothetical protein
MTNNERLGNRLWKLSEISKIGDIPFNDLRRLYKSGYIRDCGFVNPSEPREPLFTSEKALDIIAQYRTLLRIEGWDNARAKFRRECLQLCRESHDRRIIGGGTPSWLKER